MRTRLPAAVVAAVAAGVVFGGGVASAEPQPAVPTFAHGLAQAVFSTNPADWYSGEAWVQAPFDSDGDHRQDRIHVDFTAPGEVASNGLKVPVIFEDSPYYAGTADEYSNWAVDHELGFPPAFRALAPYWTATEVPCSMESAARSGMLAAEQVAARFGRRVPMAEPAPETVGLAGALRRLSAVQKPAGPRATVGRAARRG